MENSFSISHIFSQKWVESQNLPDMNYQSLADHELVRECGENPCLEAWEEFIRRFHRLIASVAFRILRLYSLATPETREDMVQSTFLKLCANNCLLLRRFEPKHPGAFLGYLKSITSSVVYDYLRGIHADVRDVGKTTELDETAHQLQANIGSVGSTHLEIFLNEINDLLKQRGDGPVEERDRSIFWLYYRQGFTAKEISDIPAMDLEVKGVESVIHRLVQYIKESLVMKD